MSHSDQLYVYSVLMHFSCVKLLDPVFQAACFHLGTSDQGIIYKFLSMLSEREQFDKESLSVMMNEASMPSHVPPLKILPHIQSGMTPPTPKSTMLNSKTMKIRTLEADLLSERHRAEEIELQYQEELRKKRKFLFQTSFYTFFFIFISFYRKRD